MKTVVLRLRVEPTFKQAMQTAIQKGQACSMSELIRESVVEHLSRLEK